MDNGLFGLVKQHIKEARVGGILGGLTSGTFLYVSGGNWKHLVGEWVVRLIFTVLAAILSAIATAWAKDAYQKWKDDRIKLKTKQDERTGKENRAA